MFPMPAASSYNFGFYRGEKGRLIRGNVGDNTARECDLIPAAPVGSHFGSRRSPYSGGKVASIGSGPCSLPRGTCSSSTRGTSQAGYAYLFSGIANERKHYSIPVRREELRKGPRQSDEPKS
jgi:hypothetical protein